MPVTITGGKYALATVSAATATTVTVSAATFAGGVPSGLIVARG